MQSEKENKMQTILDYFKNNQDLKEFEFKLNKHGSLEITDKRTLDSYYEHS